MALSISNLIGAGAKTALGVINPGLLPVMGAYGAFKKKQQTQNSGFGSPVDPNKSVQSGGLTMLNQGSTPYANQAVAQPPTAPVSTSTPLATTQTAPRMASTAYPTATKGVIDYPTVVKEITKKAQPSASQRGYLSDLGKTALGNKEIGDRARQLSEKYGSEIARIGQLGAGAVAGHLSTGTNVVGSGNAAIASQSASQRMNALGQGLQAELQGTGQQLTGQQQTALAQAQALQGANVQQSQQLGGLTNAAGFMQPAPASYGQTVFDPLTGTYKGGGGNLDPNNVASQLAQKVLSGQMTYEQAVSSLGYAGSAGQQFLNSALQQAQPGFNAPLATAQVGGQAGVIGSLPLLKSSETAAQGIKDQIVTYLASNPELNPTALVKANFVDQWVKGELSSPKYQTLYNLLNEYTNTLTPILGVGGSTTNLKTEIAQSFINAAASGQSIAQVLDGIQNMSRSKIQNLESGALGGGTVSSPFINGGGGTGSGGVFDW